jgi:4-hydroxy-3-methylbut-2-enyl diphosphate reductase
MGIKLAETAGFCMGVRRAVDIVLDIARVKGDEKIYTYGPLIHNPQTVELLKQRGIIPIDNIDDVDGGTIIIRAHGISLEVRQKIEEKGMKIVDATCPRVIRVQSIIKKYTTRGYTVLIVGDREHPEVIGLLGYSSGKGIVISNKDEIDTLPELDKVCIVAQTTQNSGEYEELTRKIKKRFPSATAFNTICDSTEKRQAEIDTLASDMDAMIVVGGKNSANTKRLAMISEEHGTPTFHIETADELKKTGINGYNNIGVSAGASTPNWIIDRVIDYITQYREQGNQKKLARCYKLWVFAVRTDIYSAMGAGFLSLVGTYVQNLKMNILNILIAALYVFSMHTINRLRDKKFGRTKGSFREESYVRHSNVYLSIGLISLILALLFSFMNGFVPFALLFFISLLGLLYNIKVFPQEWSLKKIGDIPGSKTLFIALAWAIVTVIIPQIEVSLKIHSSTVVAFMFVFTVVFAKSALSDMIDIQSDRLVGRETIPVVIGEDNTKKLLTGISILMGIVLIGSFLERYTSSLSLALLVSVFYIWICINLCVKRTRFPGVIVEGLLETNFIIAGLSTCSWIIVMKYVP